MACLSRDGAEFTQGWCDPTAAARLPSPATSGPFRRPSIHVWAAPRGLWATLVGGLLAARRAWQREVCWSLWREAGGALHRGLGRLMGLLGPLVAACLPRAVPGKGKSVGLYGESQVGRSIGGRPPHGAFGSFGCGLLALLQSAGMQRWSLRSRGY